MIDDKPTPRGAAEQAADAEVDGRKIPHAVVKRLSLYARILQTLAFEGREKVSSADLARHLGLKSAQVRKDLALFGQFGVPGLGYYVADLHRQLRHILGKDRIVRVVLIGVGNLGSALLSYGGFIKEGFTMLWGFDIDPEAARRRSRSDIPIYSIDELEERLTGISVDVAVLTVPAGTAQAIADRLVKLGINAILNFVPARIDVPAHVHVRHVDLSLELESLSYYVRDLGLE